ncbi:pheromone-regulated protein prm10 [Lithohypha guttulata]|uniref:Pheromone-regulated protein prm10 n=1 Tax=Lithohypha guttulata TaxID=1690604 RepID=A0AAN7T0L6_9EURO|nr:pheromone-regulated protein prm10 [Lithohypha guttulata]
MASISPEIDGSSNDSSRSHSRNGGIRHSQAKPRHNVKFSVSPPEDEITSPRHLLPEVRLPPADAEYTRRKDAAALSARDKAHRHADKVKKHNSAPTSRRTSVDGTLVGTPYQSPSQRPVHEAPSENIPLEDLNKPSKPQFHLPEDTTDSDDADDEVEVLKPIQRRETQQFSEARRLMRSFTAHADKNEGLKAPQAGEHRSGTATPLIDQHSHEFDYVPKPDEYKPSVLKQLLLMQQTFFRPRDAGPASHQYESPGDVREDVRRNEETFDRSRDELFSKLAPYAREETDPRRQHPDFFRTPRKGLPQSPVRSPPSGSQTPLAEGSSGANSSGYVTPRQKRPKWYKSPEGQWQQGSGWNTPIPNGGSQSTSSLGKLLEASFYTAKAPAAPEPSLSRPKLVRNTSSGRLSALELLKHPVHHTVNHVRSISSTSNMRKQARLAQEAQMQQMLADRLLCQDYIIVLAKSLMAYGAPTHRLEESLAMAARKLKIQASFQYLPGCMIISFDDPETHTTELKLLKEPTAVDLGKLLEVQHVYKDVMHNQYSIMDAIDDLAAIRTQPRRFNNWQLIIAYGVAAMSVGPFAFGSRPIDFPVAFILGCTLGWLQLVVASRSTQFSHIFEVFGTCVTSFAARGIGSIVVNGAPLFCFSALAQSSIALILPGWIILSASLELQSRNIIAGSIRMVYAIIYTLFLGFGILIGTTLMGLAYPNATSEISCAMPSYWNTSSPYDPKVMYTKFIWVPIFTVCLAIINQAKFKQMPAMLVISFCGYQVNFWSSIRFSQNIQVANALGALAIGVLANGYSRFRHGVAAAAMLPAIFVMVPSGLAASGSLVAGLTSANQITHNVTGISVVNNGTQGFYDAQNTTLTASDGLYGGTIFNVGVGDISVREEEEWAF